MKYDEFMSGYVKDNPVYFPQELYDYCSLKYSERTFFHCLAVVVYAIENPCVMDPEFASAVAICALCHDLLEDTDATVEEIAEYSGLDEEFLAETLEALTKRDEESYNEYITRLKNEGNEVSYVVKLADMKDHLKRTDTLTDRLKEKYWKALPILL